MSKHRVGLTSSGGKKRVDEKSQRAYLDGDVPLAAGLGVTPAMALDLRRQALALYQMRRWQQCIDVLRGLAALGQVHPADVLMMAGSLEALGKKEQAHVLNVHADRLLASMGVVPSTGGPQGAVGGAP
jgi:hypothetical protein